MNRTRDTGPNEEHRNARRLGILAQALVLGTLLCWALLRLTMMAGADRIFRYEGF